MAELIQVENQEGVLSLTINRPEKKNALTSEMYTLLSQGFTTAMEDRTVRVVLLKGSGDVFTAGNDLQDFAAWSQVEHPAELPAVRLIKQIVNFEKPLVAAVKGPAVGFGTTVLLHCDVVVAGHSARFSLPFTQLGVVPEFGSTMLLPAIAGRVRASQTLLLGEPFGLDMASEVGIVSIACDDTEVEAQALAKCHQFTHLPPGTVRTVKRLINPPEYKERLLKVIDEELRLFAAGLRSAEHQEAVAAFFEKRKPDFSQFD